jgi:hypothetical protein
MSRLVSPHGSQGLRPLLLDGEAVAAERRRAHSLPKLRISLASGRTCPHGENDQLQVSGTQLRAWLEILRGYYAGR